MASQMFIVNLPPVRHGWHGVRIGPISVWGNGNNGKDQWGWPNMGRMSVGQVQYHGESASFCIDLDQAGDSTHFAVITRLVRRGIPDVYCQYFTQERRSLIDRIFIDKKIV